MEEALPKNLNKNEKNTEIQKKENKETKNGSKMLIIDYIEGL